MGSPGSRALERKGLLALGLKREPAGLKAGWLDDWRAWAISCFPEEAVAFVREDGTLYPVKNTSPEPFRHFCYSPKDWLKALPVKAILHTHTAGPEIDARTGQPVRPIDSPGRLDMKNQMKSKLPWGISLMEQPDHVAEPFWWGDELGDPLPLVGRPFRHGVADCYSLIRDYHLLEHGIRLLDFPRDDKWWEVDGAVDMYVTNFEKAGFVKAEHPPTPGDVFFAKLPTETPLGRQRPNVYNHGGIYVGNGIILHHVIGYLSHHAPVAVWRQHLDYRVRHKDLPLDASAT